MEGWKEEEIGNKSLMAPCGLYCGVCGVYIATRDGNEKFRAVMGSLYGTKPEETECLGCMQPDPPKKLYGTHGHSPWHPTSRPRGASRQTLAIHPRAKPGLAVVNPARLGVA